MSGIQQVVVYLKKKLMDVTPTLLGYLAFIFLLLPDNRKLYKSLTPSILHGAYSCLNITEYYTVVLGLYFLLTQTEKSFLLSSFVSQR